MYSLGIRDRLAVSHSLKGAVFGPAQSLHQNTYLVEAEFSTPRLDTHNVVLEMGSASQTVTDVLSQLNDRCLDEMEQFARQNTTTEFLAQWVFEEIRKRLPHGFRGALKITLHETDRLSAGYAALIE